MRKPWGAVVLPNGHRLHGGSWLRMVRALIDELCLTITEAQQASATLRVFWTTHGLGYREGVRRLRPFEMHPPDRHRLLLTVAGTAIRMLCEGQVISRSPGAMLLAPSVPQGDLVSRPAYDSGGRASMRDASAQPTLGDVLQQHIAFGRTDIQIRGIASDQLRRGIKLQYFRSTRIRLQNNAIRIGHHHSIGRQIKETVIEGL